MKCPIHECMQIDGRKTLNIQIKMHDIKCNSKCRNYISITVYKVKFYFHCKYIHEYDSKCSAF